MKQLLITGFDPFGGEAINPSWEAVSRLPRQIGEYMLHPLQIPTVFGLAFEKIQRAIEAIHPHAVLSIGQAGGRKAITPEMVAINLRYASIPDNAGCAPHDEPVVMGGPAAYFATVPVRKMAKAIEDAGLPGAVSYSAGSFVCNDVLYAMLHALSHTDTHAGFIHVPFLPEQAKNGQPSMPLSDICRGLEAAIRAL